MTELRRINTHLDDGCIVIDPDTGCLHESAHRLARRPTPRQPPLLPTRSPSNTSLDGHTPTGRPTDQSVRIGCSQNRHRAPILAQDRKPRLHAVLLEPRRHSLKPPPTKPSRHDSNLLDSTARISSQQCSHRLPRPHAHGHHPSGKKRHRRRHPPPPQTKKPRRHSNGKAHKTAAAAGVPA
jgi:hypothetical protein